jgi:CelD/BcsL family acetyltransferase involved in cellulose biosynthesis
VKPKITDFYFDLFERGLVPAAYQNVRFRGESNEQPLNEIQYKTDAALHPLYYVQNVPTYLLPDLHDGYRGKEYFRTSGFAISLEGIPDVETYLNNQVKPKLCSSIRRQLRQLENRHTIEYKLYYGQIDKEEYNTLMQTLYEMIISRFRQKKQQNERVSEWSKFESLFFPLINRKRASLFAIFDEGKPIALALNYHCDRVFFYAISSYDVEYSRFGLGHTLIYRQMEWCLANDYRILDLSMGDLQYKRDWCNMPYQFTTHIIYKKNSTQALLLAMLKGQLLNAKNYLKSRNVHLYYRRLRRLVGFSLR